MCFDKSHEESKADEHHNINILICRIIILVAIEILVCEGPDKKSVHKEDEDLQNNDENREIPPIGPMCLNSFLIFHDFANKFYLESCILIWADMLIIDEAKNKLMTDQEYDRQLVCFSEIMAYMRILWFYDGMKGMGIIRIIWVQWVQ